MMLFLVQNVLPLVYALVIGGCWAVLWVKTGHGKVWALLGLVPALLGFFPRLVIEWGVAAPETIFAVNAASTLLFLAFLMFFTFKRWPIQGDRLEAKFK